MKDTHKKLIEKMASITFLEKIMDTKCWDEDGGYITNYLFEVEYIGSVQRLSQEVTKIASSTPLEKEPSAVEETMSIGIKKIDDSRYKIIFKTMLVLA